MPKLPTPLRIALGLVAAAIDELKHLPDKAIELPVLVVSSALQMSLRAQQRLAALAVRGDELISRRTTSDEPPPWATFDDSTAKPAAAADFIEPGVAEPGVAEPGVVSDAEAEPKPKPKPAVKPKPPSKTVRSPRNTAPSPFDAVGDD